MKTLTNSWSTSKRLHEPVIRKFLVCGCFEDDLPHYLACRTLWDILCRAAKLDRASLDLPPLHCVALRLPDPRKMLPVALSCIQGAHLELGLSGHSSGGDPQPLFELSLHLAEPHLKEFNYQLLVFKLLVDSHALPATKYVSTFVVYSHIYIHTHIYIYMRVYT